MIQNTEQLVAALNRGAQIGIMRDDSPEIVVLDHRLTEAIRIVLADNSVEREVKYGSAYA